MKILFIILSTLLLCSCTPEFESEAGPVPKITNHRTGKWINIHGNNPDLLGVFVQQFPECQYEAKPYEGKHPAMVIYVFRNGKAHQTCYDPDGRITSGWWWDVPKEHWILSQLDCNLPKE
jgi:hypothetical protein